MVEGVYSVRLIKEYISNNGGTFRAAVETMVVPLMKSDFVQKVGETFATRILLIGIGLVTSVLVARILGPEGRGLYAVAMAIGAIGVQFGNLGLHASNTYSLASERSHLPALVGNTLIVSSVVGGSGSVLAWIVFSLRPELAPVHGLLLMLSLLWIPFGLAYLLLVNLLLGIHEVRAYNKVELTNQILCVILIGLLMLAGAVSVDTVFSATLIALFVGLCFAFFVLKKHLAEFPRPSISLFRNNIVYGLKVYLASFFSFLVLRVDLLLIKYLVGAEQAGYYSISATMADMVYILPVVIGTILFPKLSEIKELQLKWAVTKKVSIFTGGMMILLACFTVPFARPAVKLLFGVAYLPAVTPFLWLLPGIVALSAQTIFIIFLSSSGLPWSAVGYMFVALLINITLNIVLIPKAGILGASIASTISYSLMLAMSLLISIRSLKIFREIKQ